MLRFTTVTMKIVHHLFKQRGFHLIWSVIFLLLLGGCGEEQLTSPPAPTAAVPTGSEAETAVFWGERRFVIVPEETTARFELEEDLRSSITGWALGARITVVGETNQVSGDILLDPSNLSETAVSDIQIDAHSIKTNEFFRNRAIQQFILQTEAHPFITFQPTTIIGLPDSASVGETLHFEIMGELTIRDISRTEQFEVTATLFSETELSGTATALISREAYALTIPNAPNDTNVDEAVDLYIDFVARAG